jgi:hypothetical protein
MLIPTFLICILSLVSPIPFLYFLDKTTSTKRNQKLWDLISTFLILILFLASIVAYGVITIVYVVSVLVCLWICLLSFSLDRKDLFYLVIISLILIPIFMSLNIVHVATWVSHVLFFLLLLLLLRDIFYLKIIAK